MAASSYQYVPYLCLPYLVAVLYVYWLLRTAQARARFLAASSLCLFLVLGATKLPLMTTLAHLTGLLTLTGVVYCWAGMLRRHASWPGLVGGILLCLAPLAWFKYAQSWLVALGLPSWTAPLGISYITFKHIHFLIESHRGGFDGYTWADYLAYISFFPTFVAGPIERFGNFAPQLRTVEWKPEDMSVGFERILVGAMKKFLIADLLLYPLFPPTQSISVVELLSAPWQILLFGCVAKFLYTYYDFSGYTDIALGVGQLFGIRIMENFSFPLLRSNLAEFWRGWHISLSSYVEGQSN